jgi:aspartate dehydrogenase
MVRVGLVGCGTIGSRLARAIQRELTHVARISALHDVVPSRAASLQRRLTPRPPICSLAQLIARCDLVLEAASVDVVPDVVPRALAAGREVFVMSVGGLLQDDRWRRLIAQGRGRVHIPSGALAGLDGVKAMAVGRLTRASLTTRKPPRALATALRGRAHALRLSRLRRPTVVFEGTPRQVVAEFPQNTNVAAALALASGLPDRRIRVRVVADPTIRTNRHEVDVEGDCGRIRCQVESRPSANPKTSELAVRSAIVTIRRLFARVAIGS